MGTCVFMNESKLDRTQIETLFSVKIFLLIFFAAVHVFPNEFLKISQFKIQHPIIFLSIIFHQNFIYAQNFTKYSLKNDKQTIAIVTGETEMYSPRQRTDEPNATLSQLNIASKLPRLQSKGVHAVIEFYIRQILMYLV